MGAKDVKVKLGDFLKNKFPNTEIKISSKSNSIIIGWENTPTEEAMLKQLKFFDVTEADGNLFKHNSVKLNRTDKVDKEVLETVKKMVVSYYRKNTDILPSAKVIETKARQVIQENKGNIVAIAQKLNVDIPRVEKERNELNPEELLELRNILQRFGDSEDNNFIGGELTGDNITRALLSLVQNYKKELMEIFDTLEDRKKVMSLRKVIKESLLDSGVKFEKGIGKISADVNNILTGSYPDAVAVGANYNPVESPSKYRALIDDLRDYVVLFDFLKADRTHRHAIGTRNKYIIESYMTDADKERYAKEIDGFNREEDIEKQLNGGYIRYFDLQREDFRTFRLYPSGKSGNRSRLLSCVTDDRNNYLRSSWTRCDISDSNWLNAWEVMLRGAEESEIEEIFSQISQPTGYGKSLGKDDELVDKFAEHVDGVLNDKIFAQNSKQEARDTLDEKSRQIEDEKQAEYNKKRDAFISESIAKLMRYTTEKATALPRLYESGEDLMLWVERFLTSGKEIPVAKVINSGLYLNAETEKGRYYLGLFGVVDFNRGIVYYDPTKVLRSGGYFISYREAVSVEGIELSKEEKKECLVINSIANAIKKTVANNIGRNDDASRIVNATKVINNTGLAIPAYYANKQLLEVVVGRAKLVLTPNRLVLINPSGESLTIWKRKDGGTFVMPLRQDIDKVLRAQNKLLSFAQLEEEAEIITLLSVLDDIKTGVYGKPIK